jgi:hypothetical protein
MRKITITIANSGKKYIHTDKSQVWQSEDGIVIDFYLNKGGISERDYLPLVKESISEIEWLKIVNNKFYFNLTKIKGEYGDLFEACEWMQGEIPIEYTIDYEMDSNIPIICFEISKGEIEEKLPKKVFLSHKGSNKTMVREYFHVLKELGFDPWLDEDDMVAGDSLDRAILAGMKKSCACVFFITPDYKDRGYLEDEINYAKMVKRGKNNKFAIITLQFEESGKKGDIPELLEPYVWKQPKSQFEALSEIIRALPISVGKVHWNN